MTLKINYIIATYAGRYSRRFIDGSTTPEKYLQTHLQVLNHLPHHLSQITIMRPAVDSNHVEIPNYYNLEGLHIEHIQNKIRMIPCENLGASYHQCILSLYQFKDEFDYHIFTEDDYIPSRPEFDLILAHLLDKDELKFLCARQRQASTYLSPSYYDKDCPIADFSVGIFNRKTVQHLFTRLTYEQIKDYFYAKRLRDLHIAQIVFSQILFDCDIGLKSWCEQYLSIFWDNQGKIYFVLHTETDMWNLLAIPPKPTKRLSPLFIPIEALYYHNIYPLIKNILKDGTFQYTFFSLCALSV